jgi:glycosyltransferase involved in cell wall biosynthesis
VSQARLRMMLVTQDFAPVHHSGTFRAASFARHLPAYGIDVDVVTSMPLGHGNPLHYPADDERAGSTGPSHLWRFDWHGGGKAGALERLPIWNSLSRVRAQKRLAHRGIAIVQGSAADYRPDVVLGTYPTESALWVADGLAKHFGCPLILDIRDPWTYLPGRWYRSRMDFWIQRALERSMHGGAVLTLTTTDAAKTQLVDVLGVAGERVVVIPNGYEVEHAEQMASRVPAELMQPGFHMLYAGVSASTADVLPTARERWRRRLGLEYRAVRTDERSRSLLPILDAMAEISRRDANGDAVHLHLLGPEPKGLQKEIGRRELTAQVHLHGNVSPQVAAASMRCAALLIVSQHRVFRAGQSECVAVPAKLYSYAASGRRVLGVLDEGETSRCLRALDIGAVVPPDDIAAISGALRHELAAWLTNGQQSVEVAGVAERVRVYRRDVLAGKVAAAVRSVLERESTTVAAVS